MADPRAVRSPGALRLPGGTSTPTGLARAGTTRLVALRATTSMASSITPTGSTIYSSPPPWEGENYEPRNPMESGMFLHCCVGFPPDVDHARVCGARTRNSRAQRLCRVLQRRRHAEARQAESTTELWAKAVRSLASR